MASYAVLLRGINLGKNRRIAMADLKTTLTEAGYTNVTTLLQSGNVVLGSDLPAAKLAPALEQLIEERFGFFSDVILRSRDELARVVAHNPLGDVANDGSRYFVSFAKDDSAPFDGVTDGEERYVVDGAETYIWCPYGMRDSPLIKALGKIKTPPATMRNWNTVEKILALM
ncbi:uncharacterized protein (DUF1697 family) [Actinoplanes lutulentus]|uniref:Uncharacterized protein (DUF1697 family) n=1 Tax=Actinoplanes lutulentus TaxID=1287878 RepID=A0A327ZLV7_9ACTN|nr:DUF1697 domain-containing protein [Actinoplanes lutulentus]MBB2940776.1 uncharacterized protein (DUF1697 family) [Actinoplanes lutulentus]RAK43086.1 uncharacterized protein (DUF1697 family) [Actinoplanes lutulentus]